MEKIINFLNRANRFKVVMALITCLLFLIPPSCEKDALNEDSLLTTDKISVSAAAASSSAKMYWGPREWGGQGSFNEGICPPWYSNFGNFVLKVQNLSDAGAKITTLEVRIDNVLILTAKGLSRDYLLTKTLRSLSNCAQLNVLINGDPGCRIRVWVEATFKGLGTAYGKHLYYKSVQQIGGFNPDFFPPEYNNFQKAREYCQWFSGHLLIINSSRENDFVRSFSNNGQYLIGLSDLNQEQVWRWVDWNLNRTVDWKNSLCGTPDPNCPIPWGWGGNDCMIIEDYGYNNWGNGQPNNGGGGCDQYDHHDENVAVFNNDGTWDDRALEHIDWINFVIEWDFIPNAIVIEDLFRREYPDYQYPW